MNVRETTGSQVAGLPQEQLDQILTFVRTHLDEECRLLRPVTPGLEQSIDPHDGILWWYYGEPVAPDDPIVPEHKRREEEFVLQMGWRGYRWPNATAPIRSSTTTLPWTKASENSSP